MTQGEVLQMRPAENGGGAFEYYVRKNYYKTGSLMANSCKAAAVLGDHHVEVRVLLDYDKISVSFCMTIIMTANPIRRPKLIWGGKPAMSSNLMFRVRSTKLVVLTEYDGIWFRIRGEIYSFDEKSGLGASTLPLFDGNVV